ncbi:MAG: hypothetical protein R3192_00480 [Woeseiaceae bacterium]|nr:hypothetical protein [Woeseiaceae bacterium]
MDWYSVGVGAVCGGIAGAVGTLVAYTIKRDTSRQIVGAIVSIVLFSVLFAWAKATIIADRKQQEVLAEFENLAETNPAFQSIQDFAPEKMSEIREYLDIAVSENHDELLVETNVRQIVASLISDRMPKASDEALLNSIQLTVDQLKWLSNKENDACFRYLFPQVDGGLAVQDMFSQELIARDYESTRMILSSYEAEREIPNEDSAMQIINPVYATLFAKYGSEAVAELADVSVDGIDKSRVCSITIDLYDTILARPEEDAVTALRWMLR